MAAEDMQSKSSVTLDTTDCFALKNYFSHGQIVFLNTNQYLRVLADNDVSKLSAALSCISTPSELLQAHDADQRSVKVSIVHVAAALGNAQVLEQIRGLGADFDVSDSCGRVPLHVAAWYGNDQAAKTLVSFGADVNKVDDSGLSCLMHAAMNGNSRLAKLLLTCNAKKKNHWTSVVLAHCITQLQTSTMG